MAPIFGAPIYRGLLKFLQWETFLVVFEKISRLYIFEMLNRFLLIWTIKALGFPSLTISRVFSFPIISHYCSRWRWMIEDEWIRWFKNHLRFTSSKPEIQMENNNENPPSSTLPRNVNTANAIVFHRPIKATASRVETSSTLAHAFSLLYRRPTQWSIFSKC